MKPHKQPCRECEDTGWIDGKSCKQCLMVGRRIKKKPKRAKYNKLVTIRHNANGTQEQVSRSMARRLFSMGVITIISGLDYGNE